MLYSISGKLSAKKEHFFVLDAAGVGFKLFASAAALSRLPALGSAATVFCHVHVREDALELYGFLTEQELSLFERLNSVSGIGPKSALGILSIARIDQLVAAINEGKTELLTRASGVGKKTAERVVLELKGRLSLTSSPQLISLMESDVELEETLISLGYSRSQAKTAISKIDAKTTAFKDRLREALKYSKL